MEINTESFNPFYDDLNEKNPSKIAIEQLEQEIFSNDFSKERLSNAIKQLSEIAEKVGLDPISIDKGISMICRSHHIGQSNATTIINLMMPCEKVKQKTAIRILGSLGHGKGRASLFIQNMLLKWIVMVYDYLDGYDELNQLYGVIFHYIGFVTLRKYLCHILILITRRNNVKAFRIEKLLEIQRQAPNDQSIFSLLQLYKSYYPDIIVTKFLKVHDKLFDHPNKSWLAKVNALQESSSSKMKKDHDTSHYEIMGNFYRGFKRQKFGNFVIPEIRTFGSKKESYTTEEIRTKQDLVEHIDDIEFPGQLVSILDSPILQNLLVLRCPEFAIERLNFWFEAKLSSDLRENNNDVYINDILQHLEKFTYFFKETLSSIDNFLNTLLKTWDGFKYRESFFNLLIHIPIKSEKDITIMLSHLIKLQNLNDLNYCIDLMNFFSRLTRQWVIKYIILINKDETYWKLPSNNNIPNNPFDSILFLLENIDNLCINILECHKNNIRIHDSILSFYELLSDLIVQEKLPNIILPSSHIIYQCFFSGNGMSLSRTCGLIVGYKAAFDYHEKSEIKSIYHRDIVDYFNSFVMDFCNCLWRNRAFNKQDKNALGCQLSDEIIATLKSMAEMQGIFFGSVFSITHGTVFARWSAETLRDLENASTTIVKKHVGPVSNTSLKRWAEEGGLQISLNDFRVLVLNKLQEKHYTGVYDFLYSSMASLKERRLS
ncbi:uncharacterized protein T551_02477 [Pneumocystis jirovecii RU7]|uniref:Mis6-domain-containing protein n=1 Tax=Pneumocystis jirovecii (strain RU7) TaxID=1408657 RepID=A0A0W4ZJR6_PNEJ7|nr:uncharacterized protein T551_02477 [Pneumocystis jirovecii RU7]KTW28627.1 hypothetical protein T551_02477 [Pneumocystis jirovecii RU7]